MIVKVRWLQSALGRKRGQIEEIDQAADIRLNANRTVAFATLIKTWTAAELVELVDDNAGEVPPAPAGGEE